MRLADGPAGSRVQHLGVLAVLVGVLVFAMHSLNDVLDATRPNSEDQAVRVHARPEFAQPALDKEPAYHGRPPSPQVALVTDAARVSDGNDDVLLHPPAGNLSFARHLELAKLVCGPLCSLPAKLASLPFRNLSRAITVAEMRERFVRTPVDCARLFSPLAERLFDAPASMWPPPRSMPDELYDEYTLGGRMSNSTKYYTNRYSGGDAMHSRWSRRGIDEWVAKALNASLSGNYGRAYAGLLMGAIRRADVRDKRVLVIGSESPWVEAVCLAAGAAHVTTLEYGRIVSEHPNVSALLPSEMSRRYASGVVIPPFDAVVSFSSIEHSGLGRYGDQLSPWADVVAVARAWCVSVPDAPLILGVPGCRYGLDHMDWNGHRNYGRLRLSVLLQNFRFENVTDVDSDDNKCVASLNKHGDRQLVVTARRLPL